MSVRSAFAAAWRRLGSSDGAAASLGSIVVVIASAAGLFLATTAAVILTFPRLPLAMQIGYLAASALVHAGTLAGLTRPWLGLGLAALGMLGLVIPIPAESVGLTTGLLLPSAAAFLISVWQGGISQRRGLPAATLTVVLIGTTAVSALYRFGYPGWAESQAAIVSWISYGVPNLAVFAVASAVRRRRRARRDREAERQRDAVQAERAAIRRDLHDIVSHSLTVMIAQAEAARITTQDPAADASLERIAETGREALRGLRGMIAVLSDSERVSLEPGPALTDVEPLVASAATDHHRTHFEVEGQPRPLTPEASLALYRGVQEALTNAIRHVAPPAEIRVALCWRAAHVTARIHDDAGSGLSHVEDASGTGLIGMAERVRAAGGSLEISRESGWTVTITLPVEST
ncbi:MAG: sensor histidine kinase [Arachnia sp.]